MSSGATVSVYVSVPLHGTEAARGRAACTGARQELARSRGRAGPVRVRMVCLDDTGGGRRWSLAAVGANARRAVEDSAAIGYIGEIDPAATRFSRPIVEAAGIVQVSNVPGGAAMAALLRAIRGSGDSGQLRQAVDDSLGAARAGR